MPIEHAGSDHAEHDQRHGGDDESRSPEQAQRRPRGEHPVEHSERGVERQDDPQKRPGASPVAEESPARPALRHLVQHGDARVHCLVITMNGLTPDSSSMMRTWLSGAPRVPISVSCARVRWMSTQSRWCSMNQRLEFSGAMLPMYSLPPGPRRAYRLRARTTAVVVCR